MDQQALGIQPGDHREGDDPCPRNGEGHRKAREDPAEQGEEYDDEADFDAV